MTAKVRSSPWVDRYQSQVYMWLASYARPQCVFLKKISRIDGAECFYYCLT